MRIKRQKRRVSERWAMQPEPRRCMSWSVGEISIRAFEGEISRLKRGMAMMSMVDWAIGRRVSIMYGLSAIVFNSMA